MRWVGKMDLLGRSQEGLRFFKVHGSRRTENRVGGQKVDPELPT